MSNNREVVIEGLLTTAEAGRLLQVCPDQVRQLARKGKLKPAMVIGGRRAQRLFTIEEVERLLKERAEPRGNSDAQ
jgi:excisionase family DNA binding protein